MCKNYFCTFAHLSKSDVHEVSLYIEQPVIEFYIQVKTVLLNKMLEVKVIKCDNPLYQQVLHLRNEVLRKPIGLSLFDEDLSQEVNQVIIAATANNDNKNSSDSDSQISQTVVGCVLLQLDEGDSSKKTFKLRQMTTHTDYHGKGIGRKLVEFAEKFSLSQGKDRIILNGRKVAVGFYNKMGFQVISDEFILSGIPHFKMEKYLSDKQCIVDYPPN